MLPYSGLLLCASVLLRSVGVVALFILLVSGFCAPAHSAYTGFQTLFTPVRHTYSSIMLLYIYLSSSLVRCHAASLTSIGCCSLLSACAAVVVSVVLQRYCSSWILLPSLPAVPSWLLCRNFLLSLNASVLLSFPGFSSVLTPGV